MATKKNIKVRDLKPRKDAKGGASIASTKVAGGNSTENQHGIDGATQKGNSTENFFGGR